MIRQINNAPARVMTAMVTPFDENGRLNCDGAQELAHYLLDNGSDGLVLAGTTGESPTLSAADQLDLFDVVRDAVGPDALLIGGTGSNSTAEAVEMTREADSRGSVDGILAVSPYYNRPSQYGIEHYFRAIGAATDLPVVLYNIPVRTGRAVTIDTINRLVDDCSIAAVKDATGDTDMAEALLKKHGDGLQIYSGDDSLNLAFARAGAVGAISVASHWAGPVMSRLFAAHFAGRDEEADRLQAMLEPSCQFESSHTDANGFEHDTPNPIPAKVMMRYLLGARVIGECMSPMIASPAEMHYLAARVPHILESLRG